MVATVLELDADAVASGITDRLFGLAADIIAPQAATRTGRGRGEYMGKALDDRNAAAVHREQHRNARSSR